MLGSGLKESNKATKDMNGVIRKYGMVFTFLMAALFGGLATGCQLFQKQQVTTDPQTHLSTTNQVFNVAALLPVVETAAEEGTRLPLRAHPEWRNEYQKAVDDLKVIEALQTIDLSLITEIVNRVPTKELRSDNAQIAIQGGTLVLNFVDGILAANGKTVPLDRVNDLRAIAHALRVGVEKGLGLPQALNRQQQMGNALRKDMVQLMRATIPGQPLDVDYINRVSDRLALLFAVQPWPGDVPGQFSPAGALLISAYFPSTARVWQGDRVIRL